MLYGIKYAPKRGNGGKMLIMADGVKDFLKINKVNKQKNIFLDIPLILNKCLNIY